MVKLFGLIKNRRVLSKMQKVLLTIVVCIFIVLICLAAFCYNAAKRNKNMEKLHVFMQTYEDRNPVPVDSIIGYYGEHQPEYMFLRGLEFYGAGDYERAKKLFEESEAALVSSKDNCLAFYLYVYLNNCSVSMDGYGDSVYVAEAMSSLYSYKPAMNDTPRVWDTVQSIAYDYDSNQVAIEYLEKILKNQEISLESRVTYGNCIASLDFINEDYGKSLRRFYDVIDMINSAPVMNDVLLGQKMFNNSYMAAFYFEFGDFEDAADLYRENVDFKVDNKLLNASRKYSDYINLSNCYLELGNIEEAIAVAKETETIMPYMETSIKNSVYAAIYDVYAQAAILQKNIEEAEDYLQKEALFVDNIDEDAFYGSKEFLRYSQACLLVEKENYTDALVILEEMNGDPEVDYAGLEKEVRKTLKDVYWKLGDIDAYHELSQAIIDSDEDAVDTIKKEYLEFSKYYATSGFLAKQNEYLKTRARISILVFALLSMVIVLLVGIAIIIRYASHTDQLTGLRNRKALHIYSKRHEESGMKANTSIIMIDIDCFKKFNDNYGHLKGDEALRKVAMAIRRTVRKGDFLIRYGGEEFMVILENLDISIAHNICDRMCQAVESMGMAHEYSEVSKVVTISLGLCYNTTDGTELDVLLRMADEALYEAKNSGRNQICTCEYKG